MHGHMNVKRKNLLLLPGFKIPSVQPVPSQYGDYAIYAAQSQSRNHENINKKRLNIYLCF